MVNRMDLSEWNVVAALSSRETSLICCHFQFIKLSSCEYRRIETRLLISDTADDQNHEHFQWSSGQFNFHLILVIHLHNSMNYWKADGVDLIYGGLSNCPQYKNWTLCRVFANFWSAPTDADPVEPVCSRCWLYESKNGDINKWISYTRRRTIHSSWVGHPREHSQRKKLHKSPSYITLNLSVAVICRDLWPPFNVFAD